MFSTASVTVSTISKAKMQEIIYFSCNNSEGKSGQDLSLRRERSLVSNNPAAEKARSASTEVDGMPSKALKRSFNLVGRFLVASNKFISCLMTS